VAVRHLWLADYRSYLAGDLALDSGLNAVVGDNGEGKTNIVEALAFLATLDSFRGAPTDALVRVGADRAVVRAELTHDDGRAVTIEAEIPRSGRVRVLVNKQRLERARDLLGVLRVTVFSPDDLVLVKGGPGERRRFLDDLLVSLHPRHDATRSELERVLRQRNTLLKQASGRLTPDIEMTLDVWDAKLCEAGEAFGRARAGLVQALGPRVDACYGDIAGEHAVIELSYEPAWRQSGLARALEEARADDLRRQVSTVGPHRDELEIGLDGMPARTHASQGEQRSLALALRLAGHQLVRDRIGSAPLLLLDDVFSELDPARSTALLRHLPPGQVLLTTAGELPPEAHPASTVWLRDGMISS